MHRLHAMFSGQTLFIGVRAGASRIFGRGPVPFELGLAAAVETDVIKDSERYSYSDVESTQHVNRTIGTTHVVLSLVRLGMVCDVL